MQYTGWVRLRSNLRRWVVFALGWQVMVVVAAVLYVALVSRSAHPSAAWIAPPVGLVVGTALPLQVVVAGLLRSLSR